jgi:oligopeptidase B
MFKQKNNDMLPKAPRIPHAMTQHGDTRVDNYYWLRDDTARSQKCWITCNKKMRMAAR